MCDFCRQWITCLRRKRRLLIDDTDDQSLYEDVEGVHVDGSVQSYEIVSPSLSDISMSSMSWGTSFESSRRNSDSTFTYYSVSPSCMECAQNGHRRTRSLDFERDVSDSKTERSLSSCHKPNMVECYGKGFACNEDESTCIGVLDAVTYSDYCSSSKAKDFTVNDVEITSTSKSSIERQSSVEVYDVIGVTTETCYSVESGRSESDHIQNATESCVSHDTTDSGNSTDQYSILGDVAYTSYAFDDLNSKTTIEDTGLSCEDDQYSILGHVDYVSYDSNTMIKSEHKEQEYANISDREFSELNCPMILIL